jgi:hypothetical protein
MYYDGIIDLFTITLTKTEGSKPWNLKVSEYIDATAMQGFGTGQGSIVRTTRGDFLVNDTPAEIKTKIDAERTVLLNEFPA